MDAPTPSRQAVEAGVLECIVNVAIDDSVDVARNSSRMEVSSRAFVVDLPYTGRIPRCHAYDCAYQRVSFSTMARLRISHVADRGAPRLGN